MPDYTNTDFGLLHMLADGCKGESTYLGAVQELRVLEVVGTHMSWTVL